MSKSEESTRAWNEQGWSVWDGSLSHPDRAYLFQNWSDVMTWSNPEVFKTAKWSKLYELNI